MQSISRILPPGLCAELQADAWELPAMFRWLALQGKITSPELATTFNCGIGMVLVVAQECADEVMQKLRDLQEEPVRIGTLLTRSDGADAVSIEAAESSWLMLPELGVSLPFPIVLSSLQDSQGVNRVRTALLVGSSSVSALQALVKAASEPSYPAEIAAILGADPSSPVLVRAKAEGLRTVTLGTTTPTPDHAAGPQVHRTRAWSDGHHSDLSKDLLKQLEAVQAELLVILDDFPIMLLDEEFRSKWQENVLVVHPSLLPAFPVATDVYNEVLKAGVRVTGCTVHFLPKEGSYGEIVVQEATHVLRDDTPAKLQRRVVEDCEWKALPEAVELVASGRMDKRSRSKQGS